MPSLLRNREVLKHSSTLWNSYYYEKIHDTSDLNIVGEEKFEYFRKLLDHDPRAKWMSLNPPTEFLQDEDGFKDCLSDYYARYASLHWIT